MTPPERTAAQNIAESLAGGQDSIVALATPPGRGAIAVVRISGARAHDIVGQIARPWPIEPRRPTLCRIFSPRRGGDLDHALVTTFVAPDSFTGEDLVEISGHGGQVAPALLMESLISCGGRQATAGEFTRRAVLNGKMDITQAEAIGDLIDARSEAMQRAALLQLDGGLSRRVEALRSQLISVESLIAYDIDFPEEDDGPVPRDRVAAEVNVLVASMDALLATVPAGEIIREGAVVVIAGLPNVGKSSLFNALLGQSRAIVTDVPGTTRDAIEGFLETNRWPLRLVDTAGLRETVDTVERIGIEVSEKYLARADVVLACGDSRESLAAVTSTLKTRQGVPVIVVGTKADLGFPSIEVPAGGAREADLIKVSAETGEGLSGLLEKIDEVLTESVGTAVVDFPILTRSRHIQAITLARGEVAAFGEAWNTNSLPGPVAAVHLREAATALESLIGAISTEDVLDRVFSAFCVGK